MNTEERTTLPLGDFAANKDGAVDPSRFPDDVFDLYSIPAYDNQSPEVLPGRKIGSTKQVVRPGDVLLGYASTGLHTNGYTLARRVVFQHMGLGIEDRLGELGRSVGDVLLDVHRSYYRSVKPVLADLHGLAHITGGGIPGNLVRILPPGCEAVVESGSWQVPPLFRILQQGGAISTQEMRDVFNLGVGLIAVLPAQSVAAAQAAAKADGVATWTMGEIRPGSQAVSREAVARGLDQIFQKAGFEWRGAGCSMCLAMNPDRLEGRQICASSSNRNFKGRQGSPTGRTLLMSPAMVAAAAVAGEVVDVRHMLEEVAV